MLNEKLMDRRRPARTVVLEAVTAIRVASTPLLERRRLGATPALAIRAPNQVVNEDELEPSAAPLQRALQPLILLLAQNKYEVWPLRRSSAERGQRRQQQGAATNEQCSQAWFLLFQHHG